MAAVSFFLLQSVQGRLRLPPPPHLLANGYRGLFRRGVKLATHLHLEPRLRMVQLYLHCLISSWSGAQVQLYLHCLTSSWSGAQVQLYLHCLISSWSGAQGQLYLIICCVMFYYVLLSSSPRQWWTTVPFTYRELLQKPNTYQLPKGDQVQSS
jgi:hypothetical protein